MKGERSEIRSLASSLNTTIPSKLTSVPVYFEIDMFDCDLIITSYFFHKPIVLAYYTVINMINI